MPILATASNSNFEPCPAGMQQAVCCDVIDKGVLETTYGPKHKVDIRWQTAEKMADGRPYLVQKRYTLSLNDKSTLRKDLESWRGRAFTEAELGGFDLEKLIGVNALLIIVHNKGSKGGTFANVNAIATTYKGSVKLNVTPDYVRVASRVTEPEPGEYAEPEDELTDVGF